jgi:UDP-glucose:(heptosyl)LPS alpha-1,3-glucosyltransferase
VRIGLVTERIAPGLGGAERWTGEFVAWLLEQRHEVHVVCRSDPRNVLPPGAVPHAVDCGRSPLVFAAAVAARIAPLELDVVHDMGCGWRCDVFQPHCGSRAAAIERNLQRTPGWMRPATRSLQRCLPRYRRFAKLCARQYANDGRTFIAVSRMVRRHFEVFHRVDPRSIRVVYNGVDTSRFCPATCRSHRIALRRRLQVDQDDVLLLLVAHNHRLKGLPVLIRGLAALRRQGARLKLAVVGGRRDGAYARLCRRLGVEYDAKFIGAVPDALPFYGAADVYVHPTNYDPCSLVVLEAWACGLPVITSRFNGCAELMTEGREGYILQDPRDVCELESRLIPLLDRDERIRQGAGARRLAEAHSAERNFREVFDVHRDASIRRTAA